jgi:hypothetical protein
MNTGTLSYIGQQLLYQMPVTLVALVGLILSLVFLGRSKVPAILTLLAMVILLVSSVLVTLIRAYSLTARIEYGWSGASYGYFLSAMSLVDAVSRGLGICLLLGAVFIGRKRPQPVVANDH